MTFKVVAKVSPFSSKQNMELTMPRVHGFDSQEMDKMDTVNAMTTKPPLFN